MREKNMHEHGEYRNLSPEMVDKFYKMNVNEDDLLFDGTHLREGMQVLIEMSSNRVDVSRNLTDPDEEAAEKWNRWCMVTTPRVNGDYLEFIGVYFDGSKKKFYTMTQYAWYVKKYSILSDAEQDAVVKLHETLTNEMGAVLFDQDAEDTRKAEELQPGWIRNLEKEWQGEKGTTTQL